MASIRREIENVSTSRNLKRRASTSRSIAKVLVAAVAATALFIIPQHPSEAFVNKHPSQRSRRTHKQPSKETVRRLSEDHHAPDTDKQTAKGSEITSPNGAKRAASSRKKKKTKQTAKIRKTPIQISTKSLTPSQKKSSNLGELEDSEEQEEYAYNMPRNGYSLADDLDKNSPENKELFETELTPVFLGKSKRHEITYDDDSFPLLVEPSSDEDGKGGSMAEHQGVARIDTLSTQGGDEPVRWLVSLGSDDGKRSSYALVDLPPYSDNLASKMKTFMSKNSTDFQASLDVILLTNQQCIHYDQTPGVFVTRKSDLTKWIQAFPGVEVAMYRLDIPRECRESVTQVLDGYGPWGYDEAAGKFVETGRPLVVEEWDDDTKSNVLKNGDLPPDDAPGGIDESEAEDDSEYSKEAIRQREAGYRLLAVYTPGHTFGSVTYVFPQRGICSSGHALPLEGSRTNDGNGIDAQPQGPRLDYQGYLATSASRSRQMSSALSLINNYIDRFHTVLPARGDLVDLGGDEDSRKRELLENVGSYEKLSDIYERLGIVE